MENKVQKTNGFAIAGFICSFFFALIGLILSIIGLNQAKTCNSGKGLSIAGIIISSIMFVIGIIIAILVALVVSVPVMY